MTLPDCIGGVTWQHIITMVIRGSPYADDDADDNADANADGDVRESTYGGNQSP